VDYIKIKGITFDFGGTLALEYLNKEDFKYEFEKFLHNLGFSGGKSQLNKARNDMFQSLMKIRSQDREIRLEDFYQGMLFKLGLHPENEMLDHIHSLYIQSFRIEFIPNIKRILKSLNNKYHLAIISNAMSNVPKEAVKNFGLEKFFDTIVISRDIGIRKPDPEIFRFTLSNLGLESNQVVHVGDSPDHDVKGARNAGMKAIWIQNIVKKKNIQADHIIRSIKELASVLSARNS
jgi:putative hydrolase of the HAD superfamily